MTQPALVVTDLDGTLWHTDRRVDPAVGAAVRELMRRDVPLLIATGRRVTSARTPLARLGLAPPAVVLNGALALHLGTGERFHLAPFDAATATEVLGRFRSVGLDPCVYVDAEGLEVLVSATPSTNPGHLAALGRSAAVVDLGESIQSHAVLAFGIIGARHHELAAAAQALADITEVHLDRALDYPGLSSITVAPRGQSKWDGVLAYCAAHDLDPRRVIAIADGPNDVELLANAAVRVVPVDAHPSALAYADQLIPSAEDGGWRIVPSLV